MANREEWCSNQISKLLNEESRISTLNDIKDNFSTISHEEASSVIKHLDLSLIFDCLNDSNVEQVDLACEVLTLCMTNLNLGDSTNRYGVLLARALSHPYTSVKIMALKEIQRNTDDNEFLADISKRQTLVNSIIRCVGDEDLAVAKKAAAIIKSIGLSSVCIKYLIVSDSLKVLHEVMSINEVIRLRVNEIFVDISKESDTSMLALESVGLMFQILKDIDNNDVLLKMNVIELLSQLVVTKHGYNYLESQGVIVKILKYIDDDQDPVTSQLCKPGVIKFFGHMAHQKPIEVIMKHFALIDKLYCILQENDLILLGVALDTLGYIGETNEGKYGLESTGNKITEALKTISNGILSFPTEIRVRALNCLENLFKIYEFDSKVTNLVKKWYFSMDDNPVDWIYKFAQNPFSEIRLSALGVLNALATHHWGQECFRNTPGFIEYLLDRRETFKECKEAKYEIVKILASTSVFDHSSQLRLQAFVKEGPFYVEALTEIAIEGND